MSQTANYDQEDLDGIAIANLLTRYDSSTLISAVEAAAVEQGDEQRSVTRAHTAAHRVIHNPANSKRSKLARGRGLTSRD